MRTEGALVPVAKTRASLDPLTWTSLRSFTLVDGGAFLIYYLPRRNAADKGPVKAFPDGFRMLAGNPYKRSFDGSPMANAIGINCIGGKSKPTKKHEFPTENCPASAQPYLKTAP